MQTAVASFATVEELSAHVHGVLFFDEASRFALAAVGLLSGWEVATAVLAMRRAVPSNATR